MKHHLCITVKLTIRQYTTSLVKNTLKIFKYRYSHKDTYFQKYLNIWEKCIQVQIQLLILLLKGILKYFFF